MASHSIPCIFISSFLLLSYGSHAATLFSLLEKTLVVSASLNNDSSFTVARAGIDQLHVSWALNSSVKSGADASYKTVKLQLCFAPVSQVDRSWRKTNDLLAKDKTCTIDIATQHYTGAAGNSTTWTVGKAVPEATYFVRAYVMDASGEKVAYGQTTNKNKTSDLFVVEPISGRHVSIDIAAGVFSAFSVITLFSFFFLERRKFKKNVK